MRVEHSVIEKEIEAALDRLADGIEVSVLDIQRLLGEIRVEMAAGMWIDAAVLSVLADYRAEA